MTFDLTFDPQIALLIVQAQDSAYAVTDGSLVVQRVGGDLALLNCDGDIGANCALTMLAPELIGSEAELSNVLAGDLSRHELRMVNRETADGQVRYVTLINLPFPNPNRPTGILHVVEDATLAGETEQRLSQHRNELALLRQQLLRKNDELAASNAELQHLDDLKSQFISVAAHELRTPLTSLLGFVELLLEDQQAVISARQTQFLEMINRSSQRLLSLTNNLLDITRMDANRIELHLQETDPLKLVERVANELQPLFNAHNQRLQLSAVQNLPQILCDVARAHQILGNLLGNANKYSPDGATVSVDIAFDEDRQFLRFTVKDSGIGIPLADHPKLFDRFFRASNARIDGTAGAGLGLSITRSLVEMHGGRIWFDSAVDAGSTFYVTFPVVSD